MKQFVALFQSIDQTTSTNLKKDAIAEYLSEASAEDAAWVIYFLSGHRLKRLIGVQQLKEWLYEHVELPFWLIDDTYSSVGDLAETIALLVDPTDLPDPTGMPDPIGPTEGQSLSLSQWVTERILPLRSMELEKQRELVTGWWSSLDYNTCFIVNKLLTGALRIGVSQSLAAAALAQHSDLPKATILHRLMGKWEPSAEFYLQLISADDGAAAISRPYPFCLASGLEAEPESLGDVALWQAEWKWDGIRAQIVRRDGQCFIWSRGEDLIEARFPEVLAQAMLLPDGTVLDGEILAWSPEHGVMEFSQLQRRIGRKTVGKKLLADVPCAFLAYDLLELDGLDIRQQPLVDRRTSLESLMSKFPSGLKISDTLSDLEWQALAKLRAESRARRVEGLMLKRLDSDYGTGRKRGSWWKWKIEPYTVDAVLLYAQAGHGRRANLYTDYTFGVWSDDDLVPIAKAYSGLTDKEIKTLDGWIRKHTTERFGPVRSVETAQVFELAFEGINRSTRHKCGIAVRFPRIVRWRQDLNPKDADTLQQLTDLLQGPSAQEKV